MFLISLIPVFLTSLVIYLEDPGGVAGLRSCMIACSIECLAHLLAEFDLDWFLRVVFPDYDNLPELDLMGIDTSSIIPAYIKVPIEYGIWCAKYKDDLGRPVVVVKAWVNRAHNLGPILVSGSFCSQFVTNGKNWVYVTYGMGNMIYPTTDVNLADLDNIRKMIGVVRKTRMTPL